MSKFYIANSFSLGMIEMTEASNISMKFIGVEEVKEIFDKNEVISCVGHRDTANVLTDLLGREVKYNRTNITLQEGDELIVGQLMGGRLPEGATTLPENYSFKFIKVRNNGNTNEYCRKTLSGLNTAMDGFTLLFSAIAIEDKIKI